MSSAGAECVSEPRGEWRLRAHDNEVDVLADSEVYELRDVAGGYGYTTCELRDARIARRSEELDRWVISLQLPGEGVLSAAPADDQCFHGSVRNALLNASRARARTSPTCVIASRA